jgi:arylsulfatase A-like enzyme
MDTTRYDYIDTGKWARARTPAIKRFSRNALVFENAFTPIPQTLPAHLSAFTSCLPHQLGVYTNQDIYDGRIPTLPEKLQAQGFYTAGLISLGTLSSKTGFNRGFHVFFDQGFKKNIFFLNGEEVTRQALWVLRSIASRPFFLFCHFSDPHTPYAPPPVHRRFQVLLDGKLVSEFNAYHGSIIKCKIKLSSGRHHLHFKLDGKMEDFDFFIIRGLTLAGKPIHNGMNIKSTRQYYEGAHILDQAEGSLNFRCKADTEIFLFQIIPILNPTAARRLYKQEIEYMDHHVGKLLDELKELKILNQTMVVLFADHGEGLGEIEGYFGHTRYLNRQFINVPLIMHIPGIKSKRIQTPVSLTAVTATVLELLGLLKAGDPLLKKSAVKAIRSKSLLEKPVYSFVFGKSPVRDKMSVIYWPYQSIFYLERDEIFRREFYNFSFYNSFYQLDTLDIDFEEHRSVQSFTRMLKDYVRLKSIYSRKLSPSYVIDDKRADMLKTLGYLD